MLESMWWVRKSAQPERQNTAAQDLTGQALALEDNAARAGFALACSYSSSQEYEAALIKARRAAGAYGPKRRVWAVPAAGLAAGLGLVVLLIVLFV